MHVIWTDYHTFTRRLAMPRSDFYRANWSNVYSTLQNKIGRNNWCIWSYQKQRTKPSNESNLLMQSSAQFQGLKTQAVLFLENLTTTLAFPPLHHNQIWKLHLIFYTMSVRNFQMTEPISLPLTSAQVWSCCSKPQTPQILTTLPGLRACCSSRALAKLIYHH